MRVPLTCKNLTDNVFQINDFKQIRKFEVIRKILGLIRAESYLGLVKIVFLAPTRSPRNAK